MKFSSIPNISVQQVHQPIFQNQRPFILLPLFFKECLNPQVRINKMVNEHKVNSYHSTSGLTSRIHPLIFLWTHVVFTQTADIPPCLGNIFELTTYRLLEDALASQKKIERGHF